MSSTPELLDALRLPLRGSRLIEASAGTGKTYTIAALYLRLVLGHGGEDAGFGRPLVPPDILVVTFTEAATQELRDRIRARLSEAAQAFLVDPAEVVPQPAGKDLLHDLRADYPPSQWAGCARTLRLAAEWMDEAAVSTIHGWCNRMLREHAFDSGSPFTQSLETDLSELQAEVVRDYWRTFCAPLGADDAEQVRGWWATPDKLQGALKGLIDQVEALEPGLPPAEALPAARAQAQAELASVKAPFAGDGGWADELLDGLNAAVAAKQCKMPARVAWMKSLRDWADGDAASPGFTKTAWERLSPDGMAKEWQGDTAFLDHPAWPVLGGLQSVLAQLPDGKPLVLRHAAHWCAARLQVEQMRRAQMGFNELLTRLDAALQGPNGERLAAVIRRQFPAALIDEFQDTDPLQYRIFDTVYGVAANAPASVLLLIGDPKQAIYAFRGADIYTYLGARRDTAGRHATLGTNFRSTKAMVQAVNAMFELAEQRPEGRGAFGFRTADGNPLPFVSVAAKGREERWWVDGAEPAALTLWLQQGGSGDAARMADACASEIVRLLQAGQQGRAGFGETPQALRALRPGDIAVLVNSGTEARAVRSALTARGVRSVYLSEKESVFQSPAANDLQLWLAACATPEDERLLRAALASALLGLDWAALDALGHDALLWEARVLQFSGYQRIWQHQGVLPMLRRLLHDFGVPQRLLGAGDERVLTDVLHLAELLQQASGVLDGEHALIRWLTEQRLPDAGGDAEARRLRLESDADLLKVVTVHKSKGLEYPLVFLPYGSAARVTKPTDMPFKWHDEAHRLVVALQADAATRARVDDERLGEDMRKLYVALTRARYATWIGVTTGKDVDRSALGQLLAGAEGGLSVDGMRTTLQSIGEPAIAVHDLPAAEALRFEDQAAAPQLAPEPPLSSAPRERWWIASYSALRRADAPAETDAAPVPTSATEDIYADSRSDAEAVDEATQIMPSVADGPDLHDFPRGAGPGTFLHGLLEWMGQLGFALLHRDAQRQGELATLVERRCTAQGYAAWAERLQTWLLRWLVTPLPLDLHGATPVAPAALVAIQIEMEFWLAAQQVDTLALDALVREHTLDAAPRPELAPQQMHGMLKGYVDLVFEHAGRYYVADYKSNWLGPADADYTPAAMRAAVLAHRYELQYVLYVFALHRLLRARLPDYDYARHMGGSVTLFLRGSTAPGGGLHAECPPQALIDALDALFSGPQEVAA
jgi:exodeoxyribonuclease V beta subunit